MTTSRNDRVERFRALHQGPGAFILANVWDVGSARVLAGMGFEALATSSGAFASTLGRRDGEISRDEAIGHARAVAEAVDIPVSADLENGFGHAPADAAETVRLAAGAGLAGGSIEDWAGAAEARLYDIGAATDRIAAAVEAARGDFVLTARAENFLRGNPDLDDTIARLKAYEDAGADVLMAPGLPDLAAVKAVCDALDKPLNFMVGMPGKSFAKADLEKAGVKRISLATSLYRAAMAGLTAAAREAKEDGTFGYVDA
jgi:2-methylisocitrate lyase-like PEP mutase family enzyme